MRSNCMRGTFGSLACAMDLSCPSLWAGISRCVGLIEMPATVGALKLGLVRALDDFLLT